MALQDIANSRGDNALLGGNLALSGTLRFGAPSYHNGLGLGRTILRFTTTTRCYFPQAIQSLSLKAVSPQLGGVLAYVQVPTDVIVGLSFSCGQYDLAPQFNMLRRP